MTNNKITFLINASNLKTGGGLQVAQSICGELKRFMEHKFVVVLSKYINDKDIDLGNNVEIYRYDIKHNMRTVLSGRDSYLDELTEAKNIDAVLTVFGPSIWRPRVPHLCGFARAQLLLTCPNKNFNLNFSRIKEKMTYAIWKWGFRRSSKVFYTENEYISEILRKKYCNIKVYTVSNYYNQVFDHPERWKRCINLDLNNKGVGCFDKKMVTMLTVSTTASHKNLGIMVPMAEYLEQKYPDFRFRFVLTCKEAPFELPERLKMHFVFVGKVDVSECPNLYEQADIMFMPSLLECFTATYPEAMRMEVPIVTTDLEFARGLCGEAACYYSAVDAKAAAEAVYKVATDGEFSQRLVTAGKEQLRKYDNYEQRAEKLIHILEEIVQA